MDIYRDGPMSRAAKSLCSTTKSTKVLMGKCPAAWKMDGSIIEYVKAK